MKFEIYKVNEDHWRIVADDGGICVLDDLPEFFQPYEFKNPATEKVTEWFILYFAGARKSDPYEYHGDMWNGRQ